MQTTCANPKYDVDEQKVLHVLNVISDEFIRISTPFSKFFVPKNVLNFATTKNKRTCYYSYVPNKVSFYLTICVVSLVFIRHTCMHRFHCLVSSGMLNEKTILKPMHLHILINTFASNCRYSGFWIPD